MFSFLSDLSARHERLKERIHAFRIPLSPRGQKIMGFVYFCIPVIGGYFIMQAAIAQSHHNLGVHGEKLIKKTSPNPETLLQNQHLQSTLNRSRENNK